MKCLLWAVFHFLGKLIEFSFSFPNCMMMLMTFFFCLLGLKCCKEMTSTWVHWYFFIYFCSPNPNPLRTCFNLVCPPGGGFHYNSVSVYSWFLCLLTGWWWSWCSSTDWDFGTVHGGTGTPAHYTGIFSIHLTLNHCPKLYSALHKYSPPLNFSTLWIL